MKSRISDIERVKEFHGCIDDHGILKLINNAIDWLNESDCGAINIWRNDEGIFMVDIEWNDGVSAFNYNRLYQLIMKKGKISKEDLWECS